MTERKTDDFIFGLLRNVEIKYTPNGSDIKEVAAALTTASKAKTGKVGYPEFTALVGDYLIVGENKKSIDHQGLYLDEKKTQLDESVEATRSFAENGALHYAKHIAKKTQHKKIFAFGCTGDEKHYRIRPMFVDASGNYKLLKYVDNFENFSIDNVERYYHEQVLGKEPKEVKELEDILTRAKTLHESLRNYGHLGDQEKPLVVSAILLALDDYETPEKQQAFIDTLTGDSVKTDGQKIYEVVEAHMKRVKVEPQVRLEKVISQFNIIENSYILSTKNDVLGKTPLRHYAEYLKQYVIDYTKDNSPEDVLGRFYGEFMSYSGGDGKSLGVVLTPRHITEIFCDLVEIKPTDKLFDPCCGTGGFLIAGMHHMLEKASNDEQRDAIKKNQILGVELREDMFSVATTNMILRGDGKSNLICDDFLTQDASKWRAQDLSVAFMNPPYSQAKTKETAHLSEINFIAHLLNCTTDEARVVVIIPQSTMVGKTKEDKLIKAEILNQHTLEGVITLNKDTFYGIGTTACIAVFTAHKPHPKDKYVKFINFEDDGFVINKHIGLIETERAKEKKQHLLDCWLLDKPAESKFMVKTAIEVNDEWLHSFYYFNDEIPTAAEFEKTMADYLTFEFSMITRGCDYLFGLEGNKKCMKTHKQTLMARYQDYIADTQFSRGEYKKERVDKAFWREFSIQEIFDDTQRGKRLKKADHIMGNMPYVSSTASQNGIDCFVGNKKKVRVFNDCLTFANSGSLGSSFYHPYSFVASDHVTKLSKKSANRYIYLFLATVISRLAEKYSYNREINNLRIKREKILLPVKKDGNIDYNFMQDYVQKN